MTVRVYSPKRNLVKVQSKETNPVRVANIGYQGGSLVSADLNFVFDQAAASLVWSVTHGLGKYPSVTVIDTAGSEIKGDTNYLNQNQLTITFSAAVAGTAYLN